MSYRQQSRSIKNFMNLIGKTYPTDEKIFHLRGGTSEVEDWLNANKDRGRNIPPLF